MKGELTANTLEFVDTLAHAGKNIDKIIERCEAEEQGYSSRGSYADGYDGTTYYRMRSMPGVSYRGGSYGGGSYGRDGGSFARGRGRNARRDSMGRYSSDGGYSREDGLANELRELIERAPDEMTRQKYQRMLDEMESM